MTNPVTNAVVAIKDAIERRGLAEVARSAGVPYTTLRTLESQGFRNRSVVILEKLASAANSDCEERPAA